MNLFNRYCIRCHGVDGRGVWDIPDVPDFTNTTWQATRPDSYRTRVILQGRGAVMPAFQGQADCTLQAKARAEAARPELAAQQSKAVEAMTEKHKAELASKAR